jgi:Fe-S-cluster containining protein
MKCDICRGACCEELEVHPDGEFPKVDEQYFIARSIGRTATGFRIEARCPQLNELGLCRIHDDKPLACAMYPVGGRECLAVVATRRTPEQYQAIRDEEDPEVIHDSGVQTGTQGQ